MYPDLKISFDLILQEDSHPWYCIPCWVEIIILQMKHSYHGSIVLLSNRCFVLGLKSIVQFCLGIAKYVDHLHGVIKAETLKDILGSHPRPIQAIKPMDYELRRKHALYGRQFELQIVLQISIATCWCCGWTKPFGTDPWMNKKWISQGNFQRKHLIDPYHDVY